MSNRRRSHNPKRVAWLGRKTGAAFLALAVVSGSLWVRSREDVQPPERSGTSALSGSLLREPAVRQAKRPRSIAEPDSVRTGEMPQAAAGATSQKTMVPNWIQSRFEDSSLTELQTNRDLAQLLDTRLNAQHLDVLKAIIEANDLSEDSSPFDHDDGNGVLEAFELGFQVWQDGQLVALSLGPDPYSSYGYRLKRLPREVAGLDRLEYLDVQGNPLTELPYEIGELSRLRELRANGTGLEGVPESMDQLTDLRILMLAQNGLRNLPEALSALPFLEVLRLDENPLEELPRSIGSMVHLRTLGLTQKGPRSPGFGDESETFGLTELPLELQDLPHLEILYLTGNRLGCGGNGALGFRSEQAGLRVFGLTAQHCTRP